LTSIAPTITMNSPQAGVAGNPQFAMAKEHHQRGELRHGVTTPP